MAKIRKKKKAQAGKKTGPAGTSKKKTGRKPAKSLKKPSGKTPKKTSAGKTASAKPLLRKKPPKKAVRSAVAKKPPKAKRPEGRVKGKASEESRQDALRKELLRRRQDIVREAKVEIEKYIKGENRQLVETALDDGDWSVVDLAEDVVFQKLSTHKDILFKIDEALRKLTEGTYGVCEECGEEIHAERLKVLPFAIYCRDCQEKKELMEAMEKGEAG